MNASQSSIQRPNIVIIMADDLGYSDIGCYGAEIQTPNLDKLAENGIRFLQMYNSARCCPTRASLLTGLYPHQAGIGHMVHNLGYESYQGHLRNDCVTIAEVLKSGGYSTGLSGKWHVGGHYSILKENEWEPGGPENPTPRQRGFDSFYGMLGGCGSYFNPHSLMEGDELMTISSQIESFYFTDEITEHAVSMIDEFSQNDNPFFLYVAYTAPHWPLHALPEDIERYKATYEMGWDVIRAERYERMVDMGIIDSKWLNSPRDRMSSAWKYAANKEWEAMRMSVYAAQIDRMDQGVGKIVQSLETYDAIENTLIIFLSDNGGCAEFLNEDGWVEEHVSPTRKGKRVIPGNTPLKMPGGEDTFMSYGLSWANVSNTPFRLYKHWMHEGGIATPMIIQWPDEIQKGGHMTSEPAHVKDIMATCLEAANLKYPETYNNMDITPLEGESLMPILRGENWQRSSPLFWEHEGNSAVRLGEWKLVREHANDWELYNMNEDRTELNNLAHLYPNLVKELLVAYSEWEEKCGVIEWNTIARKIATLRMEMTGKVNE